MKAAVGPHGPTPPFASELWVLSVGVLAVFALCLGAVYVWRRRGERRRAALMAMAAAVLLANVLILAWP